MSTLLDEVRDHVEKRILARGLRYWRQGRVLSLGADGESNWHAQVEGTEVYRVEVDQGSDGELTFSCSCPFDRDPVCKHIVAVLSAIDELAGTSEIAKAQFASTPRSEQIQQVLERLSKRELMRLVKELADNDRQFGHKLVARYSPGDKSKSGYLRLAREALSFGQDRHGFITYRGAERSFPGLMELLRRGRSLLRSGAADSAVAVAQAVLEATAEAYPSADDSIGLLSDSVDMALDLLGEAGAASGEGLREEVIDYCLALAPQEPYVDYGWGWKLTEIAAELAETADEQARLFAVLDAMAERRADELEGRWSYVLDQERERAAEVKLDLIDRMEGDEARLAFLREHAHLHRFRQELIRHHLEKEDYPAARQLAQEWLEERGAGTGGRHNEYRHTLLEIALLEEDLEEAVDLARELFLDTGRMDYFELLREETPPSEWTGEVTGLVDSLREQGGRSLSLAEVYAREGMWEALLHLCTEGGEGLLDRYRDELEPRFPDQVAVAYEAVVYAKLERTSNRGTYAEAADYLRRMYSIGKGARAERIIDDLISKYRRRRAMIEELEAVRGS